MSEGPSSSLMLYFFLSGEIVDFNFFSREVFVCVFFVHGKMDSDFQRDPVLHILIQQLCIFFSFLETLCIKITHVINCLVFLSDFWVFQSGGFSFSSRSIHAPMFVDYKYFRGLWKYLCHALMDEDSRLSPVSSSSLSLLDWKMLESPFVRLDTLSFLLKAKMWTILFFSINTLQEKTYHKNKSGNAEIEQLEKI
jgi:hypothetical protein